MAFITLRACCRSWLLRSISSGSSISWNWLKYCLADGKLMKNLKRKTFQINSDKRKKEKKISPLGLSRKMDSCLPPQRKLEVSREKIILLCTAPCFSIVFLKKTFQSNRCVSIYEPELRLESKTSIETKT